MADTTTNTTPFEFDLSCGADTEFDISAAVVATGIDFSNYVTTSALQAAINNISSSYETIIYTSQLINDSGFITEQQDLSNYYTKAQTNTAIANATTNVDVVQTVTYGTQIATINGTKIYAPASSGSGDLTDYYTKSQVENLYMKKTDVVAHTSSGTKIATIGGIPIYSPVTSSGGIDMSNYYTKSEIETTFAKLTDISSSGGGTCVFG